MRIDAVLFGPLRTLGVATGILAATLAAGQQTASAPKTRIVLLGTGNPAADPDRSGPATAIVRRSNAGGLDTVFYELQVTNGAAASNRH